MNKLLPVALISIEKPNDKVIVKLYNFSYYILYWFLESLSWMNLENAKQK